MVKKRYPEADVTDDKFMTEQILSVAKEVQDYINSTYSGHYSSGGVQTLDLIDAVGDAEAFCRSNILKYASRYDRKGSARKDIIKVCHYAVLLLHFNDKTARAQALNDGTTSFSVDYDK